MYRPYSRAIYICIIYIKKADELSIFAVPLFVVVDLTTRSKYLLKPETVSTGKRCGKEMNHQSEPMIGAGRAAQPGCFGS